MVLTQLRKYTKALVIFVVVAFAATLLYVGGTLPRAFGAGAVATINGAHIDQKEFNEIFLQLVSQMETQGMPIPQVRIMGLQAHLLDQMINTELMLQGATKEGIKVSDKELNERIAKYTEYFGSEKALEEALREQNLTMRQFRDRIRDTLLLEKLQQKIEGGIKVTDQDVREALRQVRSRHILITIPQGPDGEQKARAEAEKVLAELKAGKDFAALAREYSDDEATKEKGGELGFYRKREGLVKPFEEAIFSMKPGEIRGPIRTAYGFHIVQVEEVKEASEEEFQRMKDQVRQSLQQDLANEALTTWLENQKKKARITIHDTKLAAYLAQNEGKMEEAIKLYEKALRDEPQNGYIHAALAQVYEGKNDLDKALEHYRKAVELAPTDANLQMMLAQVYTQKKMTEEAVAAYKRASELEPNNLNLHMTLAQIFSRLNRRDLMAEEMKKAEEIQRAMESARKAQEEAAKKQAETSQGGTGNQPTRPQTQNSGTAAPTKP